VARRAVSRAGALVERNPFEEGDAEDLALCIGILDQPGGAQAYFIPHVQKEGRKHGLRKSRRRAEGATSWQPWLAAAPTRRIGLLQRARRGAFIVAGTERRGAPATALPRPSNPVPSLTRSAGLCTMQPQWSQEHLRWLFRDVAVEQFDPAACPRYTNRRVLAYGDEHAVAWLRDFFDLEQILEVLRTDRVLTPLSVNFWAFVFGVPAHEVQRHAV